MELYQQILLSLGKPFFLLEGQEVANEKQN